MLNLQSKKKYLSNFQLLSMQRGFTEIVILIAVLVLAAIGGAYYLGTQKSQAPVAISPSPVAQATPTPNASQAPNGDLETANWKTYTDSKYNYSINYPPDWKTETMEYGVYLGKASVGGYAYGEASVGVGVLPSTLSIEEYLSRYNNSFSGSSPKRVGTFTIGGSLGEKWDINTYQSPNTDSFVVFLTRNDQTYYVSKSMYNIDQAREHNKEVDQVISTFRFE